MSDLCAICYTSAALYGCTRCVCQICDECIESLDATWCPMCRLPQTFVSLRLQVEGLTNEEKQFREVIINVEKKNRFEIWYPYYVILCNEQNCRYYINSGEETDRNRLEYEFTNKLQAAWDIYVKKSGVHPIGQSAGYLSLHINGTAAKIPFFLP